MTAAAMKCTCVLAASLLAAAAVAKDSGALSAPAGETVRLKGLRTLAEPLVLTPADSGKTFVGEEGATISGGIFADPQFVDSEAFDFRLKPTSPALSLGFRPWDHAAAGRKN